MEKPVQEKSYRIEFRTWYGVMAAAEMTKGPAPVRFRPVHDFTSAYRQWVVKAKTHGFGKSVPEFKTRNRPLADVSRATRVRVGAIFSVSQ